MTNAKLNAIRVVVLIAVLGLLSVLATVARGAICTPGGIEPGGIFLDDFETGSDRCWTGPLTCLNDVGAQAPACPESLEFDEWMDRCEDGWPCYRECWDPGTDDACLMLQIDYLLGEKVARTSP